MLVMQWNRAEKGMDLLYSERIVKLKITIFKPHWQPELL